MDKDTLIRLFQYHYWANRRLWRAVEALSDMQFTQAPSDGSPCLRTQIVSMVSNENLWVNYLWHGHVEFLHEAHFHTRASIREEWDALEEEMLDYLDELSAAGFHRRVDPPFLRLGISPRVWEILLQIVHDAVACRAQLRLQLNRQGAPAPAHDFLAFLAEQGGHVAPLYPFSYFQVPQFVKR